MDIRPSEKDQMCVLPRSFPLLTACLSLTCVAPKLRPPEPPTVWVPAIPNTPEYSPPSVPATGIPSDTSGAVATEAPICVWSLVGEPTVYPNRLLAVLSAIRTGKSTEEVVPSCLSCILGMKCTR